MFNRIERFTVFKPPALPERSHDIFLAPHQVSQVADMAERFPGVTVVIDILP